MKSKESIQWVVFSNEKDFIWTAAIRIANNRNESDQAYCYLTEYDNPDDIGYAV